MYKFPYTHPFLTIIIAFFILGVCMSLSTWGNGGKGWVLWMTPLVSTIFGIIVYIVFVRNAYKK